MAKKLKIGVIGMSEGNGHPYSWSAIFNGYDAEMMQDCPFPAIPEYLAKQNFPEDGLGEFGEVTHIWTQDIVLSRHIAASSKIEYVVEKLEDMIGKVDAVLLARDDAENHYIMALPFLKAGVPIFIDKPLALSEEEARNILGEQKFDSQIFTCSSTRFADELKLIREEKEILGDIQYIEASISKYWDTYAIHLIDPVIAQLPERGTLINVKSIRNNDLQQVLVQWENVNAYFKVTGLIQTPMVLNFFGKDKCITKTFTNSYQSFKSSLYEFVKQINNKKKIIPTEETLETVKIIELGRK